MWNYIQVRDFGLVYTALMEKPVLQPNIYAKADLLI